jgi:hypothetical protein
MNEDNGVEYKGNGIYSVIRTREQRQRVYVPTEERLSQLLFRENGSAIKSSGPVDLSVGPNGSNEKQASKADCD